MEGGSDTKLFGVPQLSAQGGKLFSLPWERNHMSGWLRPGQHRGSTDALHKAPDLAAETLRTSLLLGSSEHAMPITA